ncbi:ABC transporter permease [Aureimonas endophytica]|uniref:ABC transporter permease n=1 Tax=Aureimonas endophytica TaxID=2027858 RepID=A0A916ZNY3_9HYPH|nr:ABC transporter permease subunit [Aureimonas endophytica]GGE04905.1 ABC transporter permease [Aureimonas endophytica]
MADVTLSAGAAPSRTGRVRRVEGPVRAGWSAMPLLVLAALYVLLPLVAVGLYSLATRWTTDVLPAGYTLEHWIGGFADARFRGVLWRSLGLAVAVAVIDILLVAPAVYWQRVRNPAIRPVLETLAAIPFAMPLLVIAFGLLRATGDYLPMVQGSLGLLVAAHVAVAFSFVYWSVDGAMAAAKVEELAEAARTCGATTGQILRRVILPNIGPGLASGAILAFAVSFNEIAIVQVTTGSRFETVQLYLLNMLKSADADFNVLAVMTMINFAVTLALSIAVVYANAGRSASPPAGPARGGKP